LRITDLYNSKKTVFSLEIFPPKKEASGSPESIYHTVEKLAASKPDFISVTYGAGGNLVDNATCEIAASIKKNFGIEAMAHLTCVNSGRDEVREMIRRYKAADIENVLVLRGDIIEGSEVHSDFSHANELAIEVHRNSDITILGACYPEGHYESEDLHSDIQNLKYKIGAGVGALITQLFFDNALFYDFIGQAKGAGIAVPIAAGIMPIVSKRQIEKTVALSGASLPHSFTGMIGRCENHPDELRRAGIDYAIRQIRDLIEHGADGIHLYTMNNPDVSLAVYEGIADLL
jgi:methylenetetrahydrofolate reductase (NADPH)